MLGGKLSKSNSGYVDRLSASSKKFALVIDNKERVRGAYCSSDVELLERLRAACEGRVLNRYKGECLTALNLASLQDKQNIPFMLKSFLARNGAEITRGIPVNVLIDSEITRLENEVMELHEKNKAAAKINKALPVECVENEKMMIDLELEIDYLTDHRDDFDSVSVIDGAVGRSLAWDKLIADQPAVVKKAISELGVEDVVTVNGRSFLCREAAVTYLDDLVAQGVKAFLKTGVTLTGRDVYFLLLEKHGDLLPSLLFVYGVCAVSYNDGQAFTCLVEMFDA